MHISNAHRHIVNTRTIHMYIDSVSICIGMFVLCTFAVVFLAAQQAAYI